MLYINTVATLAKGYPAQETLLGYKDVKERVKPLGKVQIRANARAQARAGVITELMQALGITNILDTTAKPITLTPGVLQALRGTQAFSSPESSRRVANVFAVVSSAKPDFNTVGT
jgi:hypothetical protein